MVPILLHILWPSASLQPRVIVDCPHKPVPMRLQFLGSGGCFRTFGYPLFLAPGSAINIGFYGLQSQG